MKEARHTFYGGKSGFGKSYMAGADFESLIIDDGFFGIIIDIKPRNDGGIGDHQGISEDLNFVRTHIETAQDIEEASVQDFKNLLMKAKDLGKNGIRFTADITVPEIEDSMPALGDKVCRAMMRLDFEVVGLFEECQYIAPHSSQGGSKKDFRGLMSVLGLGRTSGKLAKLTSQEFGKVHTAVYGECNVYKILFMGKKGRKYDKVLDPSDPEDKRAIEEIIESDKEDRKFIYYDSNIGITEVRSSEGLERRTRHLD